MTIIVPLPTTEQLARLPERAREVVEDPKPALGSTRSRPAHSTVPTASRTRLASGTCASRAR